MFQETDDIIGLCNANVNVINLDDCPVLKKVLETGGYDENEVKHESTSS